MNQILKGASFALAFAALAGVSHAASTPVVVKVSLTGEAGEPMSVKVDQPSVKAGPVEFDVTNIAIGTEHEVVLIKVAPGQTIMADMKKHKVDESKLESLGEVGGLGAGESGKLKVELAAGDYLLLCNHKSHYELGMATQFTVTD
jgi:uncharacterized cupredoxin-like copper-binding protein